MEKNHKIVMIAMFKNEAPVIKRMLDSCAPYVDYCVFQDNGSTDGTDQIVKDFLADNNIPGHYYQVAEGWQGFGWNRDHLIQTCQHIEHGCDWILKMDCDEVLEVDEGFDWTIFDDKDIQAFHIPAVSGNCVYYRAWMWNTRLPWAFKHDPCHETVYCRLPEIGDNFQRHNLPVSFRQVGYNEGQSWSVPTKFISDSLILEEKLIRENTFFEDLYHFWYIGKSYTDAWPSESGFPLGMEQKKEFARRAVFYFNAYVNHIYKDKPISGIDEMSYMAMIFAGEAQTFLKDYDGALSTFRLAERFAPGRNDHIVCMAEIYDTLKNYDKMLECALRLIHTDRVCPFPEYSTFIDKSMYYDTGDRVQNIYDKASRMVSEKPVNALPIRLNSKAKLQKRMFIVDNFYENPDEVREYALSVEYDQDLRWYKGLRSLTTYRPEGIKEAFENIIGEKIIDFESGYNGVFQIMRSQDQQVYHYDTQKWAAMIYLSPNAPLQSGTRLHESKINATRHRDEAHSDDAFAGDFYDSTKFDICDAAGNIYNRLVIMDAGCFHSAGPYFGDTPETGRLTHLFFFD